MGRSTQITLAQFSLFPATTAQVLESRKRTWMQWAQGLSLEEYIARDVIMDQDIHAAEGKLITWVLAPRSNPTTLNFLCSCETFRRNAIVAGPATTGDVEDVIAYVVADVFTPAKNRRKGYARHMMRLLHWALAPPSALPAYFPEEWGAPPNAGMLRSLGLANARFSVLYSYVGPEFYQSCGTDPTSRNGWVVAGAQETFRLLSDASPRSPHPTQGSDGARYTRLSQQEVIALYEHDTRWMKDDFARLPHSRQDHARLRFSFLPNQGVGAFNIRWTMDFTPSMHPVLPTSHWGLAFLPLGASSSSLTSTLQDPQRECAPFPFVTWTLDVRRTSPRTLIVTRLRADERSLPGLLAQLLAVAREEEVEKVVLWDLPPKLWSVAEASGFTTGERSGLLSAVKWYEAGSEHGSRECEWVHNEKFCWT